MTSPLGRWRIVGTDSWDQPTLDLVGPAFIEFTGDGRGEFGFVAVRGWLDCRTVERGGRPSTEFSWEGDDEGDPVSGRGWATVGDDGVLSGHVFLHNGDDAAFRAVPFPASAE